jgi:hypothetical protein
VLYLSLSLCSPQAHLIDMSQPTMPTRMIGGTPVSAIGYGAMGLSYGYGDVPEDEERLAVSISQDIVCRPAGL